MPSNEHGVWRPKAFRPYDPPAVEDVEDFLRAIEDEDEIIGLFARRAILTPAERLHYAATVVINRLLHEPIRTQELLNLLEEAEYAAYIHVSQLPLYTDMKSTAELLLCLPDRYIMSSFFRRSFNDLRAYDSYIISNELLKSFAKEPEQNDRG